MSSHASEKEVDELKSLKGKQRTSSLDLIRTKGDFYQNMKVLKYGGTLVVVRRPSVDDVVSHKDYVPCVHCLGFVKKSEMWRHLKSCVGKEKESDTNNNNIISQCQLLLFPNTNNNGASKELMELVLNKMNKVAANDMLIKLYGSFLLNSVAGYKKLNNISQRMRVLSRLLINIRKTQNKVELSLSDIISPCWFDAIVDSVKEIAGFKMINTEGELILNFTTPSLPLLVGYAIEQAASLQRGYSIKYRNSEGAVAAKGFLQVYKMEWKTKISSICLKNMDLNKFNKVQLLPITEDLLKIRSFMKKEIPRLTEEVLQNTTLANWRSLTELCGIRLTIFNRRRGILF